MTPSTRLGNRHAASETTLVIFLLMFLTAAAWSASSSIGQKKLIEFGWDEPDPRFMHEHAEEMERTPFDGCVFHIDVRRGGKSAGSFTWQAWGNQAFTEEDLKAALDELKSAKFRRFRVNFLRFNTTPARMDWFDDHAAVINNARLAGWFVRQAKCGGILFDIEQYEGPLFDYRKQKFAKEKSWEVYAAKARQRGREVMNAFQEGCPNPVVFLTFGYCLPWSQSHGGKDSLADCHYGLLAPFLDGMVDAAHGRTRLVDGHELSYSYRETNRFEVAYRTMHEDLLPIVSNPAKYHQVFSFGFGLWLDRDWRKHGWNETDFSTNYFSPEAFEASTREALRRADEYVWIYSETPRWWSKEGKAIKLPEAYVEAVRKARR